MSASAYTYTIFDANPATAAGDANPWPHRHRVPLLADTLDDALAKVRDALATEAGCLHPADGYAVGSQIHACIWEPSGVVHHVSHELTAADLAGRVQR